MITALHALHVPVAYALDLRYHNRKKSGTVKFREHGAQGMFSNREIKRPGNIPLRNVMLCCISCCTILLELYIDHFFLHLSHFCSWKCLQHSALVFRIHGTSLAVLLKEVSPYHTKQLPFHCGEVSHGSTWDSYLSNTWNSVCLHDRTGRSGSYLTWSEHPRPRHHYPRCPRAVYWNSHEKIYAVLSVPGLCEFCTDETLNVHMKFFNGTCLMSVRWPHAALLSMLHPAELLLSLIRHSLLCKQDMQGQQTYSLYHHKHWNYQPTLN
jgi:hypothetical protein